MITKKTILTAFLTIGAASMSFITAPEEVTLSKKWETESILKTPESVIYDEQRKVLYVANINGEGAKKDTNGFISKVSLTGKVEQLEWVNGLDAPKGMGIFKNLLYVTDITKIAVIDILSGKVVEQYEVEGAKFLNDLTIDEAGTVYFSDSETKKLHQLKDKKVTVWLENAAFQKPNGLLAKKDGLRFVDMTSGHFYNIGYGNKKLTTIAQGVPSGDGIVEIGPDEYLISNWNGEINHIKGNMVHKVLDTKDQKINAADIYYLPQERLVLVPTFFKNNLVAYQLSK